MFWEILEVLLVPTKHLTNLGLTTPYLGPKLITHLLFFQAAKTKSISQNSPKTVFSRRRPSTANSFFNFSFSLFWYQAVSYLMMIWTNSGRKVCNSWMRSDVNWVIYIYIYFQVAPTSKNNIFLPINVIGTYLRIINKCFS